MRPTRAVTNTLAGSEGRTKASASSFVPLKGDGNLDGVGLIGLET